MQQQQYHACNNSNITHATTAISRMQQQQYHNHTCDVIQAVYKHASDE